MSMLRSIVGRHRWLIVALVAVAIGLTAAHQTRRPRPSMTWTVRGTNFTDKVRDVSPDGRRIVTVGETGARVCEIDTGRTTELGTSATTDSGWNGMDLAWFSDDGRTVFDFPQRDRPVRAWDAASGALLFERPCRLSEDERDVLIVSNDRSTVAFLGDTGGMESRTITVWNRGWDGARTVKGVPPMALSGNGLFFATAEGFSSPDSIVVTELKTGKRAGLLRLKHSDGTRALAISDDGKTLVDSTPTETIVWDLPTSTARATIATDLKRYGGKERYLPQFMEGGRWLALTGLEDDRYLEIWDLAIHPPARIFHDRVHHLSDDGRRCIRYSESAGGSSYQEVVEIPSSKAHPFFSGWMSEELTFSRDGRRLAGTFRQKSLVDRFPMARWIPAHSRPAWFGETTAEARVIDASTGRTLLSVPLRQGKGHYDDITYLTLWPDGNRLLIRTQVDPGMEGHNLFEPVEASDKAQCFSTFDLWDVPARPAVWPIEAGLSGLAVASGIWWDSRRGRRRTGGRSRRGDGDGSS